ncbi:TIM barrel protein [Nonomuraea sp. KC401]|uniref:TIM barrel protein n=1 Tax=unclassified Nonomuraea TaxID=2593643 RepID=UPI0010FCE936|nr:MULTISPECIES: TIM barrel protein [unclassified Nonomuraea]NBE96332.1 TIM barrel protein [Nonomuraea sp. K271]TLF68739.1 TIM barrel protein [Nonomuraea sp. KC401]
MSTRVRKVANAPVSFGVFELSDAPPPLSADRMVGALSDAGYEGIDLGPVGYLGTGAGLAERLDGMLLAGGWADLRYNDAEAFREGLGALETALDVFAAAPPAPEHLAPRPTLGCSGSPERFARPGGSVPGLPSSEWPAYAARVQEAVGRCRERGFEPAFHPHLGTYVETPDDVERLLELTDVELCLDTGHLLLGGGDPVTKLREWAGRVGHVHIKDGDTKILAQALDDGVDLRELMGRGGFASLGEGELDLAGVIAALDEIDYEGWVIVEQDTLPGRRTVAQNIADQAANRERLRELGL